MRKSRVVEYDWDEKTEIATMAYEDGRVEQRHQPLPVSDDVRSNYFADLLLWVRLEQT